MKYLFAGLLMVALNATAQKTSGLDIRNLAVPNSPIFMLTDAAPSLIENPATPKAFVLGVAQSFANSPGAFPQNYSAEFTPYWWLPNRKKSVFDLVGIKRDTGTGMIRQNIWSGLKFSTVSVGILNKDLVPDDISTDQIIGAAGFRSGLVRIQQKEAFRTVADRIDEWHRRAQLILSDPEFQVRLARETDPQKQAELLRQQQEAQKATGPDTLLQVVGQIEQLMAAPPLFTWDVAAAYATYGLNNKTWQRGRTGIWSAWGTNLALGRWSLTQPPAYLSVSVAGRYLTDYFAKQDNNLLGKRHFWDLGGRAGFYFNGILVQYEYFRRFNAAAQTPSYRSVGIVNVRLTPTIYLNGAFGKGFNEERTLVALLGIRWGLGNSVVPLPENP